MTCRSIFHPSILEDKDGFEEEGTVMGQNSNTVMSTIFLFLLPMY